MTGEFVFHRESLRNSVIEGLRGAGLIDYRSGLFLTAPRRTGKSTFLRSDLIPACFAEDWEVVYVDLWDDRQTSPAQLIERAIMLKMQEHEPQIKKIARAAGATKVTLAKTLTLEMPGSALPAGTTLAEALELLHTACDRTIVLVIDEAQHALSSDAGMNTMFALKAARDALNQGGRRSGLRLVCTGSSRDKLGQLVLNTRQPFFGAEITPFPLLGRDFIEAYTGHLNSKLAAGNLFDVDDMWRAFELVGHRPEMLASIVHRVALEIGEAPNLGALLERNAELFQRELWAEYAGQYDELSVVQRSVIEVMAQASLNERYFSPFAADTLAEIHKHAKRHDPDIAPPTKATIQKALSALREKELVWRSGRGAYALEDTAMGNWMVNFRE